MSQLIVSQDVLVKKSGISNNTDFALINPSIVLVQELRLRELLGTNLYNEIITQTTPTTTLTAANLYLMTNYITPFMVCYVQSFIVNATKYRMTNIGPITRDGGGNGISAISDTTAKELTDFHKNNAEAYGQLMINYIRANPTIYPAFFTNTGVGDIIPQNNAYDIQIYLPKNPSNYLTNDTGDLKV